MLEIIIKTNKKGQFTHVWIILEVLMEIFFRRQQVFDIDDISSFTGDSQKIFARRMWANICEFFSNKFRRRKKFVSIVQVTMKNCWQSAEGNLIFPPLTHRLTDSLSHDDRFMMSWCWLFVRLSTFEGGNREFIDFFFCSATSYESNYARMRDISSFSLKVQIWMFGKMVFLVMWKISYVHKKKSFFMCP